MNKRTTREVLDYLRSARRDVTMKNMSVGNLWGRDDAPKFKDGTAVTERNVSAFIAERTELFRATWILARLDIAIEKLEESLK